MEDQPHDATRGRRKSQSRSRKHSANCNLSLSLYPIDSSDDGFRSCHDDEETARSAQTELNAKKVLKKRYESDEEDKAPEVVTTMPS